MDAAEIVIYVLVIAVAVAGCGIFFYRAVLRMLNRDNDETGAP